jgi:hypothetical protein
MALEEHTLDDSLEYRCAVCGARLTDAEIATAREAAGPFLCLTHAAEDLPVETEEEGPEAGAPVE